MLTRRRVLAILATTGIGTTVFQRALAAKATDGPVTLEMVTDAEWVSGIKLTDAQRQTAVNVLKWAREKAERVRGVELDNSQHPGLTFVPFASSAALPDPRGYEAVKLPELANAAISRPPLDEDLAFSSIRQLAALLRARKVSSVELTKLYLERLHRYDPLLGVAIIGVKSQANCAQVAR